LRARQRDGAYVEQELGRWRRIIYIGTKRGNVQLPF